jgi:rhamnosyl/mannosyltransferase
VFPSHLRSEAFGVALLEAARAGKPMISCEIGTGTSYVNIDQLTGLTVPPADATALASAMTAIWNNPDLAARMGHAARERYLELFTAKAMGQSYAALYRELATSKAART